MKITYTRERVRVLFVNLISFKIIEKKKKIWGGVKNKFDIEKRRFVNSLRKNVRYFDRGNISFHLRKVELFFPIRQLAQSTYYTGEN